MCGILAYCNVELPQERVLEAFDLMRHRGPDEQGTYFGPAVGLLHKRLSIIDLSSGREPLFNEDGTRVLVFNGEIYNYRALREQLIGRGHSFATATDGEVILHLAEEHAPADYINMLNGDFAFVIYDKVRREMVAVRDRFGIKPLYYMQQGQGLVFASEMKALIRMSDRNALNRTAAATFLKLRYCPGAMTLVEGIRKLPAGSYMHVRDDHHEIREYWKPDYTKVGTGFHEAAEQFRLLFKDSVSLRLQADVPVGVFLSGGIDSSCVLAALAERAARMHSFTVGFRDSVDETHAAERLAKHYGTSHHVLHVRPDSYRQLPDILRCFDNPVGDLILLPTYLLAQEAKRCVKVILTGEGADEYLGGYIHHRALYYGRKLRRLAPRALVRAVPEWVLRMAMPYADVPRSGVKTRLLEFWSSRSAAQDYLSFASAFEDLHQIMREPGPVHLNEVSSSLGNLDAIVEMDRLNWLEGYTLNKQDSLLMANSLEGRVPFLDHRLYELSACLPAHYHVSPFRTKRLLRRAARGMVADEVLNQPKKAFYIPGWRVFDGHFEEFVRDTLSARTLDDAGVLEPERVQNLMSSYFSRPDMLTEKRLMCVLVFCIWYQVVLRGKG